MKRLLLVLAMGALLVGAGVFLSGCLGNDGTPGDTDNAIYEPPVDTTNTISVYLDTDVVTYGDTLRVFIENVGDETLKGGMLFRIADSAGETVWSPYVPLLGRSLDPGEKVSVVWIPVRYPPDDGNWRVEELLPGDYYAEGGWWNEAEGPWGSWYIDSAEFTLLEESALDESAAP